MPTCGCPLWRHRIRQRATRRGSEGKVHRERQSHSQFRTSEGRVYKCNIAHFGMIARNLVDISSESDTWSSSRGMSYTSKMSNFMALSSNDHLFAGRCLAACCGCFGCDCSGCPCGTYTTGAGNWRTIGAGLQVVYLLALICSGARTEEVCPPAKSRLCRVRVETTALLHVAGPMLPLRVLEKSIAGRNLPPALVRNPAHPRLDCSPDGCFLWGGCTTSSPSVAIFLFALLELEFYYTEATHVRMSNTTH